MKFEVGDMKLFGLDLSRAWSWWTRGLNAEGRLDAALQYLLRPSPALEVFVADEQLIFVLRQNAESMEVARLALEHTHEADEPLIESILTTYKVKRDLIQLELMLPHARVLTRELAVPHEARGHLREVLGYQLSRLTPFSADQLFYDAVPNEESSVGEAQLNVDLFAVPRIFAEPLIAKVEHATGLRVSRLGIAGKPHANLFGRRRVASQWWRRLNLNSWLIVALLIAICALALTPIIKERELVIQRKQDVAILNANVRGLAESRSSLESNLSGLNYIVAKRASQPLSSEAIAEMTRIVPDDIFITSLRIQGNSIVMNGFGKDVVDLIQHINESSIFSDARFSAPISRNVQTGLDQFAINVTMQTEPAQADSSGASQ